MYYFYPSFTTTKYEFGIIYTLCIMNYFADFLKFIDNFIDYFSAPVYHLLTVLLMLAYILIVIGVTYVNPDYTGYLTLVSQTFIAIILIIRFNPLRNHMICSENDRTLVRKRIPEWFPKTSQSRSSWAKINQTTTNIKQYQQLYFARLCHRL